MTVFRMPSMGADMDDGMLVGWLVAPGDTVERGQVIAEIESDKGIIEAECWDGGVVEELLVESGPSRLAVGTPLARLRPADGVVFEHPASDDAVLVAAGATGDVGQGVPAHSPERRPAAAAFIAHLTPPMRHLAKELGVDVASLRATGTTRTITRADIVAAAAGGTRPRATPLARRRASKVQLDLASVTPTRSDGLVTGTDVERVASAVAATGGAGTTANPPEAAAPEDRAVAMRRAVARSMAHSKREIPHYYLATHIDMARSLEWLELTNSDRSVSDRLLPAVLLFKATAVALRQAPELNGHFVDDEFRRSDAIHLGVAISLREGGLVAPAIHAADTLDLGQLMDALRDLVTRARTWRIRSSEMSDPTVTVTNLGDRGVETAFPVIIPPQVAIVGFGRVTEQPVAVDGVPVVHPVVHATLAADHRVSDGHRGGLFLDALDRLLQQPERL